MCTRHESAKQVGEAFVLIARWQKRHGRLDSIREWAPRAAERGWSRRVTASPTPDPADLAAGEVLAGLVPLFGLHVDADRVEALRPLAAMLLRYGESLTTTIDPTLEPLEMGGVPADAAGGAG
jgi:hypothetical protein